MSTSPYQSPLGYQPPTPRRRIWLWVLLGCGTIGALLIALCGGLLYFGFRQVAGEGEIAVAVDALFKEIAAGRSAEFYRSYGAAELKKKTSEKDFVAFCEGLNARLGPLESKSVEGFFIRNENLTNYVNATYHCKFERGPGTVKTTFKHEDGHWLLLSFHVDSPELLKTAASQKCPHCGAAYEAGAKFCPACGKELPAPPAEP